MKERLAEMLHHLGLTASRFADEIGVQRSGISHILSGRNQPGYDFMVKILHKFPEINIEWLLTGKGKMIKDEQDHNMIDTAVSFQGQSVKSNPVTNKNVTNVNILQRVIVCYADGTFDHYRPAGKD